MRRFAHGSANKRFTAGCQRTRSPEETLERLLPLASAVGITRLANVTGLDEIGIPVVMAVRPYSRSLTVSQGKGVTLAAAKVSGFMESLELHHAESPTLPLRMASFNELRDEVGAAAVADPLQLLADGARGFDPSRRLLWVEGRGVRGGAVSWLPLEAVHGDCVVGSVPDWGRFRVHSNGLASGNHYLEAVAHALAELIERDAVAQWLRSPPQQRALTRLRLDSVGDPTALELLDRFHGAGVEVVAWNVTSSVQVPAFCVEILSREPSPWHPQAVYAGMGCHLDPGLALVRALTEAAQSRLTAISGGRDDLTRHTFLDPRRRSRLERWRRRVDGAPPVSDFRQMENAAGDDFRIDVDRLLNRLREAGHGEPIVVDLTRRQLGVPVVKVVAPSLQFRHHSDALG